MSKLSFLEKIKFFVPLRPMLLRFVISTILSCIFGLLAGQAPAGSNPFELAHRLPTMVSDSSAGGQLSNPFDIVPHRQPGVTKSLQETPLASTASTGHIISFPKGNTIPKSFIFGVLVAFLTFFTIAIGANRSTLLKAWRSFLSSNALNLAQREALGFSGYTPYFLLYINFLLNAGVFVYLIIQSLNSDGRFNNFAVFFICLIIAGLLFVAKHALLVTLSWLFPGLSGEINKYNFLIIVFSCVLGFFLIPFNFVIAFAGTQNWQFFVTLWLLALSGIFIIYGVLRAFSLGTKYLFGYPLHFLLYLCTAEIIPVLLIIKLLR